MPAVELYARPSADFVAKLSESVELLRRAAAEFAPVTQASSLGAEDVVITHLINLHGLDIPVFVLDTGALHPQTLALLERTRASSRTPVTVYRPLEEAVVRFVAREGQDAMYRSIELRKACCQIRKMEPLARALEGRRAWITGLRREQSGHRADVPLVDTSEPRAKFNPLARWTWGDVWHYIGVHGVDYNLLHDEFYPSIGCAPCTRAIAVGEDFRAGRWWWEQETAKECGLHVKSMAVRAEPTPVRAEPTPVRAEPTPVRAEPTPVRAEPTPVRAEPTPVRAEPTPVRAEPVEARECHSSSVLRQAQDERFSAHNEPSTPRPARAEESIA